MVAKDPLFGHWTAKKFSATVTDDIWPEVIFFTLVATVVSVVSKKTDVDLGVSNQLLTVLGLVLGLVISFRTSSAYERYQDGRKMWTNIIISSKNLAQLIWIHVPVDRKYPEGSKSTPMTPLQVTVEKKTMINLIQAYAVSVKHLLRGEEGAYYRDLYPLISFLPRYADSPPGTFAPPSPGAQKLPIWDLRGSTRFEPVELATSRRPHYRGETEATLLDNQSVKSSQTRNSEKFDPELVLPEVESEYVLKPARNPPRTSLHDYLPFLRLFRWIGRTILHRSSKNKQELQKEERRRRLKRKAFAEIVESNIPQEIILVLSNYNAYLMKNEFIQPVIAGSLTSNILTLTDTLANLERICNTPLPFAYQAHLRLSLWLYLVLLPFQIYPFYGYITIPATAFSSFLLLGFLEIGQEIENPFNYDLNDLDLDSFCLSIHRDLAEITTNSCEIPLDHIFSKLNTPFAPADKRNAEELYNLEVYSGPADDSRSVPITESRSLRNTLLNAWKQVDEDTRKKA